MQATRIGEFEVHCISEFEGPFVTPEIFFPDYDPEVLKSNPDLAGPGLIDPASGKLVFSFHCFVVKTAHHTILIDTCLGNDKERPTRPQFHQLRSPWLADQQNALAPKIASSGKRCAQRMRAPAALTASR